MVGTLGARMLELTVRYADAWNADFGQTPEQIRAFNDRIDDACLTIGRDPSTLGRSLSLCVRVAGHGQPGAYWVADVHERIAHTGSIEALAAIFRAYGAAGVDHIQVWLDPSTVEGIETFAGVLDLLETA
jgi:alkanesulfonate monooxygenase SsuD/methylene tetrahydromethanopterin reductase-like flavin-dependent oxidoreductase (luciferase family)